MSEPARWNPTPESLLSEHAWAHRLARRLLRGDAAAEDVAQEACLRALDRPPGRSPRGWLAGIVRNLAREHRRGEGRRAQREALAARPEAEPSAAAALERLAIQQDVVRAVLTLAEPYRSTIVLRFYENLPPRKIAMRQGVPVATVKSRLLRGLGELRAQLDREHGGDGCSWALFLAPLAARPDGALPFVPELAMGALLKIGLVSAAAVGLVLWLARGEGTPSPAPPLAEQVVSSATLERPAELPSPATDVREALPTSAESSSGSETVTAAPETIQGRVLDLAGVPVAGVALTLRESHGSRVDPEGGARLWASDPHPEAPPLATSDAAGQFTLEVPALFSGAVVAQDEEFETVLCPDAYSAPNYEPIVVVAPRIRLRGVVRDASGAPLAHVALRLNLPSDLLLRVGQDLVGTKAVGWFAESDAEGRFDLGHVPAVPGAHALARLAPFEDQRLTRDPWLDEELEIVLVEPSGNWLEGRVSAGGAPKADATVVLGHFAVTSGADGVFRLPLAGLEEKLELCALAPGLLPARLRGDRDPDGSVRWPSFVQLELGGEALALAGRVTDAEGVPAAGHQVWLTNPTVSHKTKDGYPVLLESALVGQTEGRHGTTTDDEGRFRIAGLEARAYTLQVIDMETALIIEAGPFQAGQSELEIHLPADALFPLVRGTVRARDGAPLADLHVSIARDAGYVGVDDTYWGFQASGAWCVTDENGAFELLGVPRSGVTLHVSGGGVQDPGLELEAGFDPLALEVVVGVRVSLQVTVDGALGQAERFACLDASGELVELETPSQAGIWLLQHCDLVDRRSPVVRVGDEAQTLVLYVGNEELTRVPLVLRQGELNRVDL
jgi:RNA polymerase sigma factor (sigma-70 family)